MKTGIEAARFFVNESGIEIRPVDRTNWADFEAFFESRGTASGKVDTQHGHSESD